MRQVIEGKWACNWTVDVELDANQYSTIRVANGTCYGDTDIQPIATVYDADHARLIAALPELLEALQTIVNAWLSPKEKEALTYQMCEAARAALAKAEGRGQCDK